MADLILATVGNAIVAELKTAVEANAFGRKFDPTLLWAKRSIPLADLEVLHVDVAPLDYRKDFEARGSWGNLCRYHVAVRKKFGKTESNPNGEISNDEILALANLTNDLLEFFMPKQPNKDGRELSAYTDAVWQGEKTEKGIEYTDVRFAWGDLEQFDQFTAWFPLNYSASN